MVSNVDAEYMAKAICYEATRAGIDPNVLLAMVEKASNFDVLFESDNGNVGLTGVGVRFRVIYGDKMNSPFQIEYNLRLGVSLFRLLLDKNGGDLYLSLVEFYKNFSPQANPQKMADDVGALFMLRKRQLN